MPPLPDGPLMAATLWGLADVAPARASSSRRVTSAPSMVSCSSSARATRSRPWRFSVSALAAAFLGLAEDALDLFVDHPGGVVGVVAGVHEVLAEEDLALGAPGHGPDTGAHAPFAHHLAGQLGGADEVVVGAGGDHAEDELLGDAPAHADDEGVLDVVLAVDVALLDRAAAW